MSRKAGWNSMERLTIKFPNGYLLQEPKTEDGALVYINAIAEKLGKLEDAEEQGLLLRLPCKVGTHIYIVNRYWIDEGHICGLAECDDVDCACFKVYEDPDTYTMVSFNEFGQTWFLTKEEAEQALKRMESE